MACSLHRYERQEDLPFRLAALHVAIGRLGKIFPALDKLSGRVITVESVPLRPPDSSSCEAAYDADPFALIEQTLLLELETQAASAIQIHRHIVCYDAIHCVAQDRHVFYSANAPPGRLVSSLLADFGKVHPLVVKNYVRGIVSALSALHDSGVVVGGISSSSVFISSDGRAQLVAYFPSARAIQALLNSNILQHDQIPRCVLRRQNPDDARGQDARSVAYVMAEMLTGMRMRGHLLEREHLLSHVACTSLETRFLHQLLLQTSSLTSAANHPYISDNVELPVSDHHHSVDDQRLSEKEQRVIAVLIEQELLKCREQRRRHQSEIRAWLAQFERRNERKPLASERPKSVTQLQRRCRALSDRTKELEARLSSARKSFYRKSESLERDENDELERDVRIDDDSSSPLAISSGIGSKLGFLPAIDVTVRDGDLSRDGFKRSPAQNAFLKRLGPQETGEQLNGEQQQLSSSAVSDRANGHQIIHQRKEVMQVINSIAASTITNSPH